MKLKIFLRIALVVLGLAVGGVAAHAQDLNAVKARMAQRISAVDSLRDRKLAGENNRGFLEPRASLAPADQQVLAEENADRSAVYAAIAAQTGATPDDVGRARARQIATASRPGVWIQAPDGSWFEKS